jgi:hypothetical protein
MSLPGQVESAAPFVPGFDSNTIITTSIAQQCVAQGYKFCLRYLSLGEQASKDLSEPEATNILNSGLALMPVQHVRLPGWSPTQSLGQQYGQSAATNAQSVGFPAGVNVWCDLEGVNPAAAPDDVIAYCEAWFQAVNAAGFFPGIYVGASAILTGQQLFDLSFKHYWRSQSRVPEIPTRGYQLLQLYPAISINGIAVDIDITQNDNSGGQAQWLRLPS